MLIQVYSLYDTKSCIFTQPSFFPNDATCMRAVQQLVRSTDNQVAQYPSDFIIYHIGEWDDSVGVLASNGAPRNLGPCSALLNEAK